MKKLLIVLCLLLLAGVTGCKSNSDLKAVDKVIKVFLENYAREYVNYEDEMTLDYYVVPAIKALERHGYKVTLSDYVGKSTVANYYEKQDYNDISSIFKAGVNCRAYGITNTKAKLAFENYAHVETYNYNYGLMATYLYNANPVLKQIILEDINIIRAEDYRDADYAGVALMATSHEDLDREPFFTLIKANLSKDGVMFWGTPAASTTANVILGLIALGIDPTSVEYTTDGVNLIQALLTYEEDGAFHNNPNQEIDFAYATPQAFAACVAFKIYQETGEAFNLFI